MKFEMHQTIAIRSTTQFLTYYYSELTAVSIPGTEVVSNNFQIYETNVFCQLHKPRCKKKEQMLSRMERLFHLESFSHFPICVIFISSR